MGAAGVKRPIFERFSTGLLVGAVATLAMAASIDSDFFNQLGSNPIEIFGILAALAAAVLALMGVQRQINVHQEQAQDNRQRDLKASIAVLPLVLSNFYKVCEQCFEISLEEENVLRNPSLRNQHISFSEADQSAIGTLQNCIRFSDHDSAEWLSAILRQFQLCKSRFASLVEGPQLLLESNRRNMATDWLVLRAMIEHCFEFSRGEVPTIPAVMRPERLRPHIGSRWFAHPIFNELSEDIVNRKKRVGSGLAADWFG